MKNPIFFKTRAGNQYFYDCVKNRIHYCSQTLKYILEHKQNFNELKKKINQDKIIIEKYISAEDFKYNLKIFENLSSNGYFIEKTPSNTIKLNEGVIENVMFNVNQITFEVTENCNLKCNYCAYGELYEDYTEREHKKLSFEKAKTLINYINTYWSNLKSDSKNSKVFISFYGGEPLCNFSFIKDIVEYVNSLSLNRKIQYAITTNATIIHKYIDFLIENKFNVLISLDGNLANNKHRVFKNGLNSFTKVYQNTKAIQYNYPEYFDKHVNFNTVLHNYNSVTSAYDFIKKEFGKTPNITEIRGSGIKPNKKEIFNKMHNSVDNSLQNSLIKEEVTKNSFIKLPFIKSLGVFLHQNCGYNYQNYSSINDKENNIMKLPSGTCLPFSKKIYVTSNGLLLPCENVDHQYALGEISDDIVKLNFEKITEFYNDIFDSIKTKCESCYINKSCQVCFYTMDKDKSGHFFCPSFMNDKRYAEYLSKQISKLEGSPSLYNEIIKKVAVN